MRRLGACCNCTTPAQESGFCGCGTCRQAASVTIGPVLVPRQFKDVNGDVQTTLVQVYNGGTIPFNEDSIGQSGVLSCYYGEAFTEALDDTALWGLATGTTPSFTCWGGSPNVGLDANYYFGANIKVTHTYNDGQRSYIGITVTPRFQAVLGPAPDFDYLKGVAVDDANNDFSYYFQVEQDFAYQGPYRECEGPLYSTAAETCHGALTVSLNYTDPLPSLCDCWSNENGGGCQFDSTSPFSNMVLDLDGEATKTQDAPSYWDFDGLGPFIVVPFDDGVDREFHPITNAATGTGRLISLQAEGTAGSVTFSLDACEGNVQGTGVSNPNDTINVDITGGSDCT